MATVFLNGAFVAQDEARLSAFDASIQHGVGLFETMLGAADGSAALRHHPEAGPGARVFRLEQHLDRLIGSARDLGLSNDLRRDALAQAVLTTVAQSGLARARVRLTITGGDLNLLGRKSSGPGGERAAPVQPTVMIVAQPATEYPEDMFERGVSAVIADLKLNPLDQMAGHKTINYWGRLRELQVAAAKGAGEALIFQVTNFLAGGCVSNAFIVRDGELWTPIARGEEGDGQSGRTGVSVPSPVLPGITRAWLAAWAEERGLRIVRRMVNIEDVLGADEAFLTNSSWGVLPIVRLEKEQIGSGEVGEITSLAREAWLAAAQT
jgi:branched-subunit amino acid aminotransferase/4-amino-4-deoxychorismate lyase